MIRVSKYVNLLNFYHFLPFSTLKCLFLHLKLDLAPLNLAICLANACWACWYQENWEFQAKTGTYCRCAVGLFRVRWAFLANSSSGKSFWWPWIIKQGLKLIKNELNSSWLVYQMKETQKNWPQSDLYLNLCNLSIFINNGFWVN